MFKASRPHGLWPGKRAPNSMFMTKGNLVHAYSKWIRVQYTITNGKIAGTQKGKYITHGCTMSALAEEDILVLPSCQKSPSSETCSRLRTGGKMAISWSPSILRRFMLKSICLTNNWWIKQVFYASISKTNFAMRSAPPPKKKISVWSSDLSLHKPSHLFTSSSIHFACIYNS